MPPLPEGFHRRQRIRQRRAEEARIASIPVARKAAYVRRQVQDRDHHCHWPGCEQNVPPAKWGCARHWRMLPKYLRDNIWAAYRPGQEVNMTPSRAYLQVADEVQQWIEDHHG